MWITDREQSQTIDRLASEQYGIPSLDLMEAAAQAVVDLAQTLVPKPARIAILCGSGNNGGDGIAVARILREIGYRTTLLICAEKSKLGDLSQTQLKTAPDPIFPTYPQYIPHLENLENQDLIIDALLGTGASSPPKTLIAQAIQAANASQTPILSIDIPSGIDCDTGQSPGESIQATHTLTIGNPKPLLFQNKGLEAAGNWSVAPINFPTDLLQQPTAAHYIAEPPTLPVRSKTAHKGTSGRLLIVAGSDNMPGAAILAATAALRAGIGLVTLASTPEVCRTAANHLPEILLHPLAAKNGVIAPEAAQRLYNGHTKFDAALVGPGLTTQPETLLFLKELLFNWNIPTVLDADALNLVAQGLPLPNTPCVLTPHPGELARLLSTTNDEIQFDRFAYARQAAKRFNQTILLKGAYSIVATLGQPLAVNSTGNPGMATGGMGDVLGGIIATLLAQNHPPHQAAVAGMYWHGLAADLCAAQIGPAGYTASEVATNLPRTRAKLTAS